MHDSFLDGGDMSWEHVLIRQLQDIKSELLHHFWLRNIACGYFHQSSSGSAVLLHHQATGRLLGLSQERGMPQEKRKTSSRVPVVSLLSPEASTAAGRPSKRPRRDMAVRIRAFACVLTPGLPGRALAQRSKIKFVSHLRSTGMPGGTVDFARFC